MSIQAMVWVFDYSQAEGSDRLVLLAIANHADAKGWNAWPSIEAIAREARVSARTVYRCVQSLVDLGELMITHSGGGRHLTNHYGLPMKRCQIGRVSPETVTPVTQNPDKYDTKTVTRVSPEPKENRPEPRARTRDARTGGPPEPSASGPGVSPLEVAEYRALTNPTEEERARSLAAVRALIKSRREVRQ